MKRKIAYNDCFGGFSLSEKAVKLGRELTGDPKWGGVLVGEYFSDGSGPRRQLFDADNVHLDSNVPRHDKTLISVIEKLGAKEASGRCAHLQIAEVEGKYRIDEYDGLETVATPDSYEWVE